MGRKPIKDKAIPVTVYVAKSVIKSIGGIKRARSKAKDYLECLAPDHKYWHDNMLNQSKGI